VLGYSCKNGKVPEALFPRSQHRHRHRQEKSATKKLGLFLLLLLAISTVAIAQTQTVITMGEVGFQPVNGLTVKGVTFTDTTGADIGAADGGQQFATQDPVIEGQTAGETLTMTFSTPAYGLQFGVALSTQGTVNPGFTVQLYDPAGTFLGTFPVIAYQHPGDNFTGGLFSTGLTVGKAVVTFNSAAASAFGLDNVAFPLHNYFTSYYSNANTPAAPDATVRVINDGYSGGNLWASIYVFDDSEELTECCSCVVTPDGLLSESVNNHLTANPITGIKPTRGVIKIISSSTESDVNTIFAPNTPYPGLRPWATHVQKLTSGYAVSETQFADSVLMANPNGEQAVLESLCLFDHRLSGKPCTCTPEDFDF
jgi:hypothetical protein